jgi:hypothetical protein
MLPERALAGFVVIALGMISVPAHAETIQVTIKDQTLSFHRRKSRQTNSLLIPTALNRDLCPFSGSD